MSSCKLRRVKIGNKVIGNSEPILTVAEMACSHDGSLKVAKKLVDAAVSAYADVIQVLIFARDYCISPNHEVYDLARKLELRDEDWIELFDYIKKFDIFCSAIVEDMHSAELASRLGPDMFKIHSCDLLNPELIRYVAQLGKPISITVGAASLSEIERAVSTIRKEGNEDIMMMYGYQNYPTKTRGVNLRYISSLKQIFHLPVGYSDHTDGDSEMAMILPMLAIPYGASILEKHITLDRSLKGTDYESSLNPDEFKRFVKYVRMVEEAIGDGAKREFTDDEVTYRRISRKSIVASKDIKKGERITRSMLAFMRSKPGLAPIEADRILGLFAKKKIKKYQNITLDKLV